MAGELHEFDATMEQLRRQEQPRIGRAGAEHWRDFARQWKHNGPPLRPSREDVEFYREAMDRWARDHGSPRALILGVTPELYHLPWPQETDVLAVDHTQSMIDVVWPGPRGAAICGNWTALPLAGGSRNIVLGDGVVHLVAYPQDQPQFAQTLHRVIASGGICVLRLFVPPSERESPEVVLKDLLAGKIPDLSSLKIRLCMAMQTDVASGVQLKQVWDAVHKAATDFAGLAARIGWSLEHLQAINTYRDCPNRYHFRTLDEVRELFCKSPGGFEVESIHVPTYALGERCPTVVFRRV